MRNILLLSLFAANVFSEPVAVHYIEGTVHGFLTLRSSAGKILAAGDLIQKVHGDEVVSHLTFHFKDGSLDEETATFSQRGSFHLLTDHHIQRGPVFTKPMDVLINVKTANVTVRYQGKAETEHMDLPDDLANGFIIDLMKNIPVDRETKVSFLAATPKPRLVKLSIKPAAEDRFSVAGTHYNATRFQVKVEIGGIAGLIAPFIGKQPEDVSVWISRGEMPTFVRSRGPQFLGGPSWTVELTSPVWPN